MPILNERVCEFVLSSEQLELHFCIPFYEIIINIDEGKNMAKRIFYSTFSSHFLVLFP